MYGQGSGADGLGRQVVPPMGSLYGHMLAMLVVLPRSLRSGCSTLNVLVSCWWTSLCSGALAQLCVHEQKARAAMQAPQAVCF